MITLDGPSVAPKAGGEARQLIVFLHGYGSNGDDLIALAPYWADILPEAEFLSPNAPFPCEINPYGGFQWFGFEDRSAEMILGGTRAAAAILDGFLDAQLQARGLDERSLALVGFSQGTMMSLHVGLRRKMPPAAILGFSGMLVGAGKLKDEVTRAPPVLLIHGDQDPMIPIAAMFDS
ncbi:MAG TPA: phospholipase, partial [Candidatus Binatia bacterium]|nr:phospholipase [Candidatus Binatia bacterium]